MTILDVGPAAYHRRRALHASDWLTANIAAPREERDRATTYQVAAEESAKFVENSALPPQLPDLEALFIKTRNRLYFWQAIAWALRNPQKANKARTSAAQIPDWCLEPLKAVATRLVSLGMPGTPRGSAANVQKALGLISKGANAYGARARQNQRQHAVAFAAKLEAAGLTPQRARKVVFPRITDAGSLRRAVRRATAARKPQVKP
jgi:hypothetical protein